MGALLEPQRVLPDYSTIMSLLLGLVCAALVAHHPLRSSVSHEMRELVMEQQEEETPQPEGTQGRIDESASPAASALRESLDGTPDDAVLLQDRHGKWVLHLLPPWQPRLKPHSEIREESPL